MLISCLLLASCSESLSDNSPALQAFIDNNLFRANDMIATEDGDGGYIIEGFTRNQVLTMRISGGQLGVYPLGESSTNYATFLDPAGNKFFTNPNGNGQVVVSDFNQTASTISGSFKFDAIQTSLDTIRVRNGIFFEVPLVAKTEVVIDPDVVPIGSCNSGTFVSIINDVPIQQGNNLCVQAVIFQDQIVVTATDPDDEIQLRMPLSIGVGQNVLPKEGFVATYKEGTSDVESTLVGSLFILSHNTQANLIKGSFSFETANHSITTGSFNVTYQ